MNWKIRRRSTRAIMTLVSLPHAVLRACTGIVATPKRLRP
jgi:hypothetical protein